MELIAGVSGVTKRCVVWVRYLRKFAYFKYGFFAILVFLMVAGLKVALMPSDLPESLDVSDKVIHFVVFFGFTFLADIVSSRGPFWLWKVVPVALYGVGTEILQLFSPDRSFSLGDILADFCGIATYWCLKQLIYVVSQKRLDKD